jgi:4-oxalocrotonate tautomerase
MPILNVKVSGDRNPELAGKIANILTELTSRILRKDPRVTAIAIDFVPRDQWIVGGNTLAAQRKNSVYFDVKITDETNTKDEKERYIREAFAAFKSLLGELHEESYIYVQDVRAAAYGYGGLTQEHRYQHPPR